MNTSLIIGLLVGLIIGIILGLVIMRQKNLRTQFELQQAKNDLMVQQTNAEKQQNLLQAQWDKQVEGLRNEFKILSDRMIEDNNVKFSQQSNSQLDKTLLPFSTKLEEFKKSVEVMSKDNLTGRAQLGTEIQHLVEANKTMNETTLNLTKALTTDSKMQGDFGEMILQRMLEQAGLRIGQDYTLQENFKDADSNGNQRPDAILYFPNHRSLIIDSKVSLTDYSAYTNAENNDERNLYLSKHLNSVKKHINELADKNYRSNVPNSLDFVLMFMPIEGAYSLALQADGSLFEEAYKKNVLPVTPTNLYAVLHIVHDLWNRDKQEKNVTEIIKMATALYDKFAGFLENYKTMGNQLNTVKNTYDKAGKQLYDGQGNLMKKLDDIRQIGGIIPNKEVEE